jgi:hypothetical protein
MVLQASNDDSVRQVLNKRGRSGYGMSAFVFRLCLKLVFVRYPNGYTQSRQKEEEKLSTRPKLPVLPHYEAFRTEIRMPSK